MLSTIGRAAIRRIGGGTASTNRAFQSLWSVQRADSIQSARQKKERCYATATTKTDTAKPKAKKTTTAVKTTAKPKAKKVVVKKVAKKKAAPTKKLAVKKKKPVVKKKKVLSKPKKAVLTDAQKLNAEMRLLKVKALLKEEPAPLPSTAWNVVMTEEMKADGQPASVKMPAVAAKYKNLSPSDLEGYNHIANQNKIANEIALKKWVESYTPVEINNANNARRLLRKRTNTKKFRLIADDRKPKRPTSAMLFFVKERHSSGDLKGVGDFKTTSGLLMAEWKALSESERKQYEDAAAADKTRYIQEFKTVFNRDSTAKI